MAVGKKSWFDIPLLIALLAACLYWLAMYLSYRPTIDWSWPLHSPAAFLYPALIYPVLEEIVFRGWIQEVAHDRLKGQGLGPLSRANLATSALFTALHFINHPPAWAAAVFVPSLIFGYFKDRTGGLGAPIGLHVFYNAGYFWIFTGT